MVLRDLAAATEIDLTLLSRFESGERGPTPEQVERLARCFGETAATAQALRIKGGILSKYADDPALPEAIARIAEEAGLYMTKPTAPAARKGAR
jgi:transcriptional regulator with XRE-family HTH domain